MSRSRIPIVDIERLEHPRTLAAIGAACREWGVFQVVGHSIDHCTTRELFDATRAFFAQPSQRKRMVSRTAANPWGFYDRELTKNTRDWKEIFDYGPPAGEEIRPQWPRWLPGFEPAVTAFYRAAETLAFRLLAAVSATLGMPAAALDTSFRPHHTSFVRLNYYPRCERPERPAGVRTPTSGHLWLNHHTDAGALTVLVQDDQPGLEVFRRGAWHLVEPHPDALVVNIGDIVQVWSNDRYEAALHRVVADPERERLSVPFFFNPAYSAEYAPLPTTVDRRHPPRYRPINWGEFRRKRAVGDYADHGEEVQIGHYRR